MRDDTASLASYALSGSVRNASPLPPPRSHTPQSNHENYFTSHGVENGSVVGTDGTRHDTIPEVSEPVTPESETGHPTGSLIADMLRRSPTNRSVYGDDHGSISDEELDADVNSNGRLIITPNGVKRDTTERTPLLAKNGSVSQRHPDWIHGDGEQDIEAQTKRKSSWPNIHEVKERGADIAKVVFNPRRWDRHAVASGALGLFGLFPAVGLGLLLNILDALSYGTYTYEMPCALGLLTKDRPNSLSFGRRYLQISGTCGYCDVLCQHNCLSIDLFVWRKYFQGRNWI